VANQQWQAAPVGATQTSMHLHGTAGSKGLRQTTRCRRKRRTVCLCLPGCRARLRQAAGHKAQQQVQQEVESRRSLLSRSWASRALAGKQASRPGAGVRAPTLL
jgi:hypothetical protein